MTAFTSLQPLDLPPIQLASSALDPDQLPSTHELMHWSGRLTHATVAAGSAILAALAVHALLFWLLRRIGRRSESRTETLAARGFNQSMRWAFIATGFALAADADKMVAHIWAALDGFVVPAITGWVIHAGVKTAADLLSERSAAHDDELTARTRRTRITIFSRSAGFVIIFVTVAMILLGFPAVRHVGATLIASAGLFGLAIGAAAQPALKSLVAGIQIALTQPIRIGDFVVVDNENGRVEDIRLSYVVVRTGDERRLIIPTTKFLDTTFQNWTRVGGITGSVVLPIKPGFAIAPMREAYLAMLAQNADWDERTGSLLVSEAKVGYVEIKLVMSAAGPNALAELRLAMREAMLEWLRVHQPESLCDKT
jgi:small-conductance mechanosensitive channel